ncbi:MFS transporter [Facilibium subflavum]|uniref:MFS transporter n=1 Tax=Facilibium subflavum TaxID=2219058 RepID=UPI000E64EF7A|nr:MFS transporter [Facilibium subflavum]
MKNRFNLKTIFAWFICLLAALFYSYDFFIRVAPSVMVTPLIQELGLNTAGIGLLGAAYFYTYILFQIPAGLILDRFNTKIVVSFAMFTCVLGNFLFSHADGFMMAFIGRLLMGFGSAFGFIGAAKLAAMWLPQRFFSSFISLTTILGLLGGFFTDTVLSTLVRDLGWRNGNEVFTYIGFVIFVLMLIFIKDNPKAITASLPKHQSNLWQKLKQLGHLCLNYRFWANALIGGFLFMPINVLATMWGVGFVQYKFHLIEADAANINSLLFMGNAIGCVLIAFIAPYTDRYRALLIGSCTLLLVMTGILIYLPMPLWLFSIGFILMGVVISPQVLTFDIGKCIAPKGLTASAVSGVNLVNNIIAAVFIPLIGWLIAHMTSFAFMRYHVVDHLIKYQVSFVIIPLSVLLCIPLCFLLPKRI